MENLKIILGEEFYNQFIEKVNAWNGNEANKDKQVKYANLASGEYVAKGKYDGLQASFDGQKAELDKANGLIAELQKGTKDNAALQEKITAYEAEKAQWQAELQETKIKAAAKVGLLSAGVEDIDYVTFKLMESLKEKGKKLELDDADNIKDWDVFLKDLQTQLPKHFPSGEGGDDFKLLESKGLPKGGSEKVVTKEQFRAMSYEERMALKQSNEKLYQTLRG